MLCAGTSSSASKPSISPDLPVCSAYRLLPLPLMALRQIQMPPNQQRAILWHIQAGHDRTLHSHSPGFRTKRSLQYTYILTLPLVTIYSVGNAVIKYQEGFVVNSEGGGKRHHCFWPLNHSLMHPSVPQIARSMDEGSPKRNLPANHVVVDWFEP